MVSRGKCAMRSLARGGRPKIDGMNMENYLACNLEKRKPVAVGRVRESGMRR